MYQDKTLQCRDCGADFIFTEGEQAFYAEKGFQNEPTRCKDCRVARKTAIRSSRKMHTVVCAECGGEAIVPFEPRNDRPILCSDCYAASKGHTSAAPAENAASEAEAPAEDTE